MGACSKCSQIVDTISVGAVMMFLRSNLVNSFYYFESRKASECATYKRP
jgi:hypothetical protein